MGVSKKELLKDLLADVPTAVDSVLNSAALYIVEQRPKFRGPDGDVEWFDAETRVKERAEMRCRCFKCGCEARLEVHQQDGLFLSLQRCRSSARCSFAPECFVEFRGFDENGSQAPA
jgi:hypothetical protein